MKDLTTKQNNLPAEQSWGQEEKLSTREILISKLLAMQGLSKLVIERKAVIGEYRDSVTGELLGGIDDKEPLQFIPVKKITLWTVNMMVNGKAKFYGIDPDEKQFEYRHQLPKWTEEKKDPKTGKMETFKYFYTIQVFVLLPKDLEMGNPKPYTLSFRSKSLRGGQTLVTQMHQTNANQGLSPSAFVMNLDGKMDSNDNGSFVVLGCSLGRKTTDDELQVAYDLWCTLRDSMEDFKVDNSDLEEAPVATNQEF